MEDVCSADIHFASTQLCHAVEIDRVWCFSQCISATMILRGRLCGSPSVDEIVILEATTRAPSEYL